MAFAVVDGVLLEPLPYATPERLVALWESNPRGNQRNVVSPANFLAWRDELVEVDRIAAIVEGSNTVFGDDGPERVGVVSASAAYFDIVGAEALRGRLYADVDDRPEAPLVVVLSEDYWRRRFGADPAIVGTTIRLGNAPRTVVGVLPDRFDLDTEAQFGGIGSRDVWAPQRFGVEAREASGRYLQVVGRLAPGSSLESLRAEASALASRLVESFPDRQTGWGVNAVPLHADIVGEAGSTVLIVFGAVCLVLLIACANVVNLLLTRAIERQQEMAVRSAMGAGRGRILTQLTLESAWLAVVGGALGLLGAWRGLTFLVASAPEIPRIDAVGLDGTVMAFALLATAGTTLLFGLAPVLGPLAGDLASRLRDRASSAGRDARRLRGALTVAQVSLSLMLLVGAGLLGRSLAERLALGVGFEVEGLGIAEVQASGPAYASVDTRVLFFEQLVERVRGLPGVLDASAVTFPPLAGSGTRTSFWPLDRPVPAAGQLPGADVRWVHRDYHRTLGLPVLDGRLFDARDDSESALAVLVNESGARQIWPGESAIGKRIAMPWDDTLVAEVVGVVGDVRHQGPDTPPYPMFYYDHRQFSGFNQMSVVVRSASGDIADIAPSIRTALAELDPGLPLYNVRAMDELFGNALRRDRFATTTLGLFALLALALAAVGIYGVVAHAAERRGREIGIRLALGASRGSIVAMVVGQGMVHVGVAIGAGLLGAVALARFLRGLVFDVSTTDPLTLAGTALLLVATGFGACWIPAWRASRADPSGTIRSE
jgi:putative ABC transport system permease protein